MKICTVCGAENEDTALYCRQCGAGEFRATAAASTPSEETMAPPGPPNDWITVWLPEYPLQADIITGRLNASGIECIIARQTIGGWNAQKTFRDVQVRRKDFTAAKALLGHR